MAKSETKKLKTIEPSLGSLAQRTYSTLRDAIINLKFKPGELIRKSELCASLGVSRSPISEAISRLAQEGLVEVFPQAGTYVARFSMDEIREGAFIREALELAAIERLGRQISQEQIVLLRRNIRIQEAFVADEDFQGFYGLDREFHQMLLAFTDFKKLTWFAETAWVNVDRARQLVLPVPGRVAETLTEHQAIFQALQRRNPAAARAAMQAHLGRLMSFLTPLEKEHPEFFLE